MAGFHDTSLRDAYFTDMRVNQAGKYGEYGVVPHQPPKCPECGSTKVWKDGFRRDSLNPVQRWLCRECGYRFSDHVQSDKKEDQHTGECRVRVSDNEMINLATVETRTQEMAAGATVKDTKSLVFEYAWQLKKQGYKELTVKEYAGRIACLLKYGADVFDPESVKTVLAQVNWKESTKAVTVKIYSNFLSFHGLTWREPAYKQRATLKFIPNEKEIDDLISCCGKITSLALRIAKETGARIGEIAKLRWIDVDREKRILRICEPEKGSNPRALRISADLIAALDRVQKKGEYVFMANGKPMVTRHLSGLLLNGRKTAARKLVNPRLLEISFHTLRHWKGTMEYHKTRDILHVKELLGHKCIVNTMVYIDMEKALYREANEDFIVKAAGTLDEACKLLEDGFEYVCEMDGKKLFKKRN